MNIESNVWMSRKTYPLLTAWVEQPIPSLTSTTSSIALILGVLYFFFLKIFFYWSIVDWQMLC